MIPQRGPLSLHAMNEYQHTVVTRVHGMGSRVMCTPNKQHLVTRINLE